MMKKRLSKTLWYGTDVDSYGNPIIPSFTADAHDLDGLHVGELFLHYTDGMATLWTANESGDVVKISGGEGGVDLSQYLLISEFNKIWEIRYDSNGSKYIFGKLPVVTQYGITMYAQDGSINIPTIAEGLPFDEKTIWFNPTTGQIEVIGGTGGGSGEGVSNFWDLSGIPSWITNTKPTYSYSEIQGTPDLSVYALASQIPSLDGYAKLTDIPSLSGYATEQWVLGKGYALSSDLSKYIPIAGVTDITGEKNFIGGLKVNGSPIYYDTEKKFWKLEGDLLVTGGVTMYGNEGTFTPSTIMDAILYDDTTLGINSQGQLYVKGSVGGATTLGSLTNVGSWADSVAPQDRIMYQAANSSQWVAKNLSDLAVGGVTGNYLPLSGGTMTGTINTQFIRPSVNAAYQCGTSSLRWDNVYSVYGNFSDSVTINGNTAWHAGNDGSGSGLDADLLDGKHLSHIIRYEGRNDNGNDAASAQTITYWGEGHWGHGYTYGTSLNIQGAESWNHRLDFRTDGVLDYYQGINTGAMTHIGTIAFTSSNVASATKLATARTIWGQSFDGTGDIGNKSGSDASSIRIVDNRNNGEGGYQAIRFYYNTDNQATIHYFHNNYNGLAWTTKNLNIEADYITLGSWNNPTMIVNRNTGNVGIGTINPSQKLHVVGNILVTGGTTMYSARKLKNIQDERGLSLDELSVIKPTRFTWKDGRDDKVHIGGIADDVMKVLPEVIYKTEDDTLTMDYGNAAFAIAASLIKPAVNHEERIKVLEEENKRLKEEVEQLKWNIA